MKTTSGVMLSGISGAAFAEWHANSDLDRAGEGRRMPRREKRWKQKAAEKGREKSS